MHSAMGWPVKSIRAHDCKRRREDVQVDPDRKLKFTRIAGLGVLAYALMLTYSVSRPATESLFLEAHTSKSLPIVWLSVAAGMILAVTAYNRFVVRTDLLRLLGDVSAASAMALAVLLMARAADIPGTYYALYMWKDIYVILLVEIYYSYSDSVFPIKTARWIYGFFGVLASLGSMTGNLLVGSLARQFGTATALWFVPPVLCAIWLFCIPFSRMAGIGTSAIKKTARGSLAESFRIVRKSSYLILVLALIALVQIVVTLVDFQFNTAVEGAYSNIDQRTAIIGKVYAALSFGTVTLQALTGPILRLAGVPLVLLAVPFILCSGLGIFVAIPRFATMALVKIASKCFDYTIFKTAKEILYIPLTYAEKTEGKSIVDMMMYRVAKGGASILIIGLAAINAARFVSSVTFVLIAAWLAITAVVVIRFRRKVSREEEMTSERVALEEEAPCQGERFSAGDEAVAHA